MVAESRVNEACITNWTDFDEWELYAPDLATIATHEFHLQFVELNIMSRINLLAYDVDLRFEVINTIPVNVDKFEKILKLIWYKKIEVRRRILHVQDPVQRCMLGAAYQRSIGIKKAYGTWLIGEIAFSDYIVSPLPWHPILTASTVFDCVKGVVYHVLYL
ncbi:uncharacterized protein N7515_008663 [Penicillium bovifimosum]|uniref:Uncharacterized protein n=1 Tax=Penicillium bovifimosum TaxID=126998 RepID=A0A9W9KY17_9EURO|nr:uncharacterized protein N7515_008663 [Penicillium bovifimosum]KAJ5124838.1 hypothetical protein N7515_008663 [Penicillium bovifimosum]